MWLVFIVFISVLISGCAPGLYLEDSKFLVQELSDQEKADADKDIIVIPVTAQLIAEKQQLQPKPVAKKNNNLKNAIANHEYRVGPQDVLTVTVWDHPELTIPAGEFRSAEVAGHLVRSDGTIFFPHIGVITVAGLTLEEIRRLITKKIKKYIVKPQLDVRVVSFRSQKVHVAGEVKQAGEVPVTDAPLTLIDVLTAVGGPSAEADLENVSVTRDDTIRKFNVQNLYDYGDGTQNILLADGDIVHVPDRSQKKVFVLGEVKKSKALVMNRGRMTLAEAIGEAEGFDSLSANPYKVYVIRGEEDQAKIYWLNAESPDMLLLATNFQLLPQDVVYVSTAKISRWNRIISQILPSVQLLWLTRELTESSE